MILELIEAHCSEAIKFTISQLNEYPLPEQSALLTLLTILELELWANITTP